MVVDIENVILRGGLEAQVVEQAEELGTVVGAVIDDVEEHLPQDQVFVLPFGEGFFEEHIVL